MRRFSRRVDHPDQLEFSFVPWRVPLMMPRLRAECESGPRPCPFMLCRYHLAVDPQKPNPFPFGPDPDQWMSRMSYTCALDVADHGAHSTVDVANMVGVSRQRVAQIETEALAKLGEFFKREKPEALTVMAPMLKKLFAGGPDDDDDYDKDQET